MNNTFDKENQPRIPEHRAEIIAISRMMDHWSEELYRRRNHDESKVPPWKFLPLPETLEEWEMERKNILKLFEEHIYGAVPPPPDKLEVRLLAEKHGALNGLAYRREIRIYCKMNDGRVHDFDMLLYVPENASGKVPVFVGLNFNGNQANTPDDDVRLTRGPAHVAKHWWRSAVTTDDKRFEKLDSWNFVEAMQRGYAVATANFNEIFPDNPFGFAKSIYTLFKTPEELAELPEPPIAPRNYGAISAWAWGLSRMMDVLEDIPEVDTEKAAVLGHSRLGKTALWAGVNDERFKLVISNNSGCMGAAPSCRVYGERPGHLAYIQRFWFSDKFIEYADREDTLPVDQHQLLALIAPRTVYVASSSEDYGADPYGEFLSAKEAAGIWALYARENDFPDSFPELNKSVGSSVKYHCKTGGHSITAADWQHYYECADKLFKQQ